MIIVADSGPLAYLALIDISEHVPTMYGQVFIPNTVLGDLCHEKSPVKSWAGSPPAWPIVRAPKERLDDASLDDGEADAISLAIDLHADRLLIDEKRGRMVAKSHGLIVTGTLAAIIDGSH